MISDENVTKEELSNAVLDHIKWYAEDQRKWTKNPVWGATENLVNAFSAQMQTVYDIGRTVGLSEAHEISKKTCDWVIQDMRNYAKKHPKTTLESYLKKNYPEEEA